MHEEGVEDGDIIREHVDVQLVLSLEVLDEFSQSHLTAVILQTLDVKTIPQGPLNVIVLYWCMYRGRERWREERGSERERERERVRERERGREERESEGGRESDRERDRKTEEKR